MKRTFYGLVMPLMAVFFFLNSSAAHATDLFPCKVDSNCGEEAFPTLNPACVKAYVCNKEVGPEFETCTFVPKASCDWEAKPNCNDKNDCTTDFYSPWSESCRHWNFLKNGKHCDDGDDCTLDTKCSSGTCGGGKPLSCDDGDSCTDDVCDPNTGCTAGATVNCDDGKECTIDSCNPATGICSSANSAFPTVCGPANSGMVCNGVGACVTPECLVAADCGPSVSSCSGGIRSLNQWQCNVGKCELGSDPEFEFPCEFGCNGDVCATSCNDGDPCTTDTLVVIEPGVHGNCVHEDPGTCCSVNADCTDGNDCTEDVCTAGTCSFAAAPLDGDACGTAGTCDAGVCEEPPPPALSGSLEVASGNMIEGSIGPKKPGSDPPVPKGDYGPQGTIATFANPECFLGNVKLANEKYALGGNSSDPLVTDPDGNFCGGITVDETMFLSGKSPTALGCDVECIDQGVGKLSTLNWLCGSCAQ